MRERTANGYKNIRPNTQCTALVPYEAPKHRSRRTGARLITCLCAFFCLLTLSTVSINILLLTEGRTPVDILLSLSKHAFLGMANIETVQVADMPSYFGSSAAERTPPSQALPPFSGGEMDAQTDTANNDSGYPITAADISCGGDVHTMYNETKFTPDTAALLKSPLALPSLFAFKAQYGQDAPYVLIIHTHGTESYAADGADTYTDADAFRSADTEENVVAVGAAMAQELRAAGISTLHCTEMFDEHSYNDAYSLSAAAVLEYLRQYPSIQLVLDVHRDSVIRSDGTKIRPVTTVNGADTAQCMIVVGTNEKGANHPHWRQNLALALKIQNTLIERSPTLVRAINLRGAAFNQQHAPASLLFEIGSCGNTLPEAKRAAVLFAQAITQLLMEG